MRRLLLLPTFLTLAGMASAQASFTQTFYPTPGPAAGVVSGDFNRDGRPDMAVANGQTGSDTVTVFLGTGGGAFDAGTDYSVSREPSKILTADMNNDGALDLVMNHGQISASQTNSLTILLGNGNGTFRRGPDLVMPRNVFDFDLGDFDHNGGVDVATIHCDSERCDVEVGMNDGSPAFTLSGHIQMTGPARSISVRDMTADGNLDVILIRTNEVLLFTGNELGELRGFQKITPPRVCTSTSGCTDVLSSLAVGDFNNDTLLDFAVLQAHACGAACGDNTIYIYRNAGVSGGFADFTRVFSKRVGPTAGGTLTAADLNGDQNIDLANSNTEQAAGGNVYVPGNGNSTFGAEQSLPGGTVSDFRVRDLNLDSRQDIMIGTYLGYGVAVGLNTNAFTNCAPPNSANIVAKICAPLAGATVSSPLLVKASGNSPAGVQRLEIWVDGIKRAERWSAQIARRITLASGSHRITVVAVDKYKGTSRTAVVVNVP